MLDSQHGLYFMLYLFKLVQNMEKTSLYIFAFVGSVYTYQYSGVNNYIFTFHVFQCPVIVSFIHSLCNDFLVYIDRNITYLFVVLSKMNVGNM